MYVKVKVYAGARKNAAVRKSADAFDIWVKAPAERGLANKAVKDVLAGELKTEAKRLRLVKGALSPAKIFEII
jgi:uncharacterized protein YggU (UPF0235/DUF167 family)